MRLGMRCALIAWLVTLMAAPAMAVDIIVGPNIKAGEHPTLTTAAIAANLVPLVEDVTILVTPFAVPWPGPAVFLRPVTIRSRFGVVNAPLGGELTFEGAAAGSEIFDIDFSILAGASMYNQPRVTALCDMLVQRCTFSGDLVLGSGTEGGGMHVEDDVTLKDCDFSNFHAEGSGGGLQMTAGSAALVTVTFSNCHGSSGGGIDAQGDVDLVVSGGAFNGCQAEVDGGAICFNGDQLTISETGLRLCSAANGGAVWARVDTLSSIEGCLPVDNTASGDGGAIHASGNVSVTGLGTISDNEAGGRGGAMYLADGAQLTGFHFRENEAATSGGAIHLGGSGSSVLGAGIMTFIDNQSDGGGGAISCGGTGQIIEGIEFRNNEATSGGAVSVGSGGARIFNCLIEENMATNGGGLYANGIGTLDLRFTTIRKNQAELGGGVWVRTMGVDVSNCTLDENVVSDRAGGGFLLNASGIIRNTMVMRHASPNESGGLHLSGCTVTMEDCEVFQNTAQLSAGGILVDGGTFSLKRGRLEDNWCLAQGGGLYAEDAVCTLDAALVQGNYAVTGGGIRLLGGDAQFTLMQVLENIAQWGGGVAGAGTDIIVHESTFSLNEAQEDGGGLLLSSSGTLDCNDSMFDNNLANLRGGNLFLVTSTATLTDTDVLGGTAPAVGGGMVCLDSPIFATGCVISGNSSGAGGGIYAGGDETVSLLDVSVQGNMSNSDGGGLLLGGTTNLVADRLYLVNNTLSEDSDGDGSGIYGGFKLLISNSLIVDQSMSHAVATTGHLQLGSSTVARNAGTILCSGSIEGSITNSILWDNIGAAPLGVSITYSCDQFDSPGSGNISVDPLFVSPDLFDFSLQDGSPCRDEGKWTELLQDGLDSDGDGDTLEYTPLDLLGSDRVMGADVDMGAYEYPGEAPPSCDGDLNGDGVVNIKDLLILIAGWGTADGDVNDDGTTNILDLLILLDAWGPC